MGQPSETQTLNDAATTVADLRTRMQQFVDERDWSQFHDAKNLAMSLAIEAAELMEHFQWVRSGDLERVTCDSARMSEVRDELADVACYLLALCNTLDVDLASAVTAKLVKNAEKYPSDAYHGRYE